MEEIWKDIEGHEGLYQVSNMGNVKSLDRIKPHNTSKSGVIAVKGVLLKKNKNYKGYLKVQLSNGFTRKRETKSVHRLVAIAFIDNEDKENFNQVNHIDGDKTNNKTTNLEWCNNSMNQIHAYKTGLNKYTGKSGRKPIKVAMIDLNSGSVIKEFKTISEASKYVGNKGNGNIQEVCKGNRTKCKGYGWKYIK